MREVKNVMPYVINAGMHGRYYQALVNGKWERRPYEAGALEELQALVKAARRQRNKEQRNKEQRT